MQDRLIDFNVIEQEKFINVVLDFTLQIAFKKAQLAKFWCSVKEKYPQSSEKTLNQSVQPASCWPHVAQNKFKNFLKTYENYSRTCF